MDLGGALQREAKYAWVYTAFLEYADLVIFEPDWNLNYFSWFTKVDMISPYDIQ